ncbi:MAG: MarR family transcriptional regulator [Flavobacteriales bacterium]|nr:MarR family transcriptional regulator [Flavobacteriales bacterium]
MNFEGEIMIGALLGRSSHKLRLLMDKVFHKNNLDVNAEQFIFLKYLSFNDGANQQELSVFLERDKTTVARLVSRLEGKNLILKINSKEDKRVNNIYLTNYGKQLLEGATPFIDSVNEVLMNSITPQEFEVLVSAFKKISDEIDKYEEKL